MSGDEDEPGAKRPRDNTETNGEQSVKLTPEESSIVPRLPYTATHSFQRDPSKFHLLIGVTGSVAAIKLLELVSELHRQCPTNRLQVRIMVTNAARHFIDESHFSDPIYEDRDEWSMWTKRGDPVLHIELRRWADALLIAPLDANTMAKIANGQCDNLLTSVVRAWDSGKKTLYFAPAMNTMMWESPLTYQQRKTLKDLLQFKEIPPIEKTLMCGDEGLGAMATLQMIASVVAAEVKARFAVYSYSN